jgi:uncharacterized protein (TIGR00369 family)
MNLQITSAFGQWLGLRITSASRERVEAEMKVREDFGNVAGNLHGGVIMSVGDILGGRATRPHLPAGATTATLESKTNFFATIVMGDTVRAVCTPLHIGRSTVVLETRIMRGDGKLAAIVTQTQMVIQPRPR